MRECLKCHLKFPSQDKRTFCKCGGLFDDVTISISGTRDSFGIGKSFYDPKTSQYIDNYKSWEKAGFMQPKDTNAPDHIHKITKEKMKNKSFQKSPMVEMAEKV